MGPIRQWQHARKIKTALRNALDGERHRLSSEQAEVVSEFIEAGEWKLAADQLVDALDDLESIPLMQTTVALEAAKRLMGVQSINTPSPQRGEGWGEGVRRWRKD